uniref:Uncharacterized protein n=1 Tax=Pelusios castaneus TaxID=367368 RepID=A0A8C8VN58_9SAUR
MLKRKRVIVNGASTGIGEQMAYHLARMGAHILDTAQTDAKLQKVVTRCLELGAASAHYVSGTMEDEASAEHVVKEAEEVLGTLAVHCLEITARPLGHAKMQRDVALLPTHVTSAAFQTEQKQNPGYSIPPFSPPAQLSLKRLQTTIKISKSKLGSAGPSMEGTLGEREHCRSNPGSFCSTGLENAMKAASDLVQVPAAPKEECTLEIIKGGALRHREVYYKYIMGSPGCKHGKLSYAAPGKVRISRPEMSQWLLKREHCSPKPMGLIFRGA